MCQRRLTKKKRHEFYNEVISEIIGRKMCQSRKEIKRNKKCNEYKVKYQYCRGLRDNKICGNALNRQATLSENERLRSVAWKDIAKSGIRRPAPLV